MGPGLPGLGIAGIFYAIAALLAPFREIALTVRGKSSLERWRLVGRQFALAVFIVGAIVGFYLGLAALERRGVLSWSGGARLLTHVPTVLSTVAVLGVVLLLTSAYGWWVRWTSEEESADSIATAHRAGGVQTVIDLRDHSTHSGLSPLGPCADWWTSLDVWEREALGLLRVGDTDRGIDTYLDRGRIAISANAAEARTWMLDDWAEARTSQTAVMLASRVTDVEDLNRLARRQLQSTGEIAADEVQLADRGFATGDLVLALRNDRRLDLLNGTRAVVERIDLDRRVIECRSDDQRAVTIPFAYVADGHLTHAYAMTVHKSQGATFDRCVALAGDQVTKESAYTALSRERAGNDLYVVNDDPRMGEAHMTEVRSTPIDMFRTAVRRSGAQGMALDELERHARAIAATIWNRTTAPARRAIALAQDFAADVRESGRSSVDDLGVDRRRAQRL